MKTMVTKAVSDSEDKRIRVARIVVCAVSALIVSAMGTMIKAHYTEKYSRITIDVKPATLNKKQVEEIRQAVF